MARQKRKKRKDQPNYPKGWHRLDLLSRHAGHLSDRDALIADDIMNQFVRSGRLSNNQWKWAAILLKRAIPNEADRCFVYLISAGTRVKIGVSKKPRGRLGDLQTAHSEPLVLLAQLPFPNRTQALTEERRLHSLCVQHQLVGEWFSKEAVAIFNQATGQSVAMPLPVEADRPPAQADDRGTGGIPSYRDPRAEG